MLTDDMKIISVDDHIIEHRNVWTDRLPKKYQEMGPHVVEVGDGRQDWSFEGEVGGTPLGMSAVAGTDFAERGFEPVRFDEMRPGYYDPKARLEDMDAEGVWAQLNFPNAFGFAGSYFFRAKDKDLALLCVKAWNDFSIDEWAATAPDRYIPMAIVPYWDVEASVREVERVAAKGARTISFPDNPGNIGLPSFYDEYWDPFFSAVEEADLPLSMHFGTGGSFPSISKDATQTVATTIMGSTLSHSMVELLLCPVFHKHPDLKVIYSEGQIGWMPYFLQRLDQVWEHYRFYNIPGYVNKEVRPSDLFKGRVFGCFIDDEVGLKLRHDIGVDQIMIEADYPHADCIWPNTRQRAETVFADIPDDEVRKIVETNARTLFRFPDRTADQAALRR